MGSVSLPSATPQFIVIGAGSRGNAYARAVTVATAGSIAAVAEIDDFKRQEFGQRYIWGHNEPGPGQTFSGWQEFIQWENSRRQHVTDNAETYIPITGAFICTLDDTHAEIIQALAPLNLHILCEKPLALSLSDCLSISRSLESHPSKIVSIGHVLRYSPHNILLRNLLVDQQVIGEVVSIEHTEPIGWWHFAHSYVRGNWRRATKEKVGSLLTKSCHDIDFMLWLLCSPSNLTGDQPHLPSTISSHGALTHFRKARKPVKAGNATNCINCAAEPNCNFSAIKIYRDRWFTKERDLGWPLKIVVPEIEDIVSTSGWEKAESELMIKLEEDYTDSTAPEVAGRGWYGRCVYESDNDVIDEQTVTLAWDNESNPGHSLGRGPKTALFHMTYPTESQCERRGRIYGSLGEISYDSNAISVHVFSTGETQVHVIPKQNAEVEKSHGGGDWGLAAAFVQAVIATDSGSITTAEAQRSIIGCDLEEIIRSHAMVFAAEEARRDRKVVHWEQWWRDAQVPA